MKNKTLGAIAIAFIGLLILGYIYLLYKVFTIFGLWTLVWTGIVSLFSGSALMLLATSKKVEGDKTTPIGKWRLEKLYYRPDRILRPKPKKKNILKKFYLFN